jgi:transcriptional regulator with XRE-family HTH domain
MTMTDFLEQWANQSKANAKLVAQELLITEVTEEIWKAMEEAGVNKAELAKQMGTTKGYVSQVLSGSRNMTLRTLADICFALSNKPTISLKKQSSCGTGWQSQKEEKIPPGNLEIA